MRALKTWAVDRMTKGTDTPFAWFQFMKLLEVLDTFLEAGDEAGLRDKLPPPQPRQPRAGRADRVVRAGDDDEGEQGDAGGLEGTPRRARGAGGGLGHGLRGE